MSSKQQENLQQLIEELGYETVGEARFGPYFIDIWLPSLCIGVEFDGPSHGLRGKKDAQRDLELVRDYGVKAIVRIKEKDLADPERIDEKIRAAEDSTG